MSPIERIMHDALKAWADDDFEAKNDARFDGRRRAELAALGFDIDRPHLRLEAAWSVFPEHVVGPYRCDFAIVSGSGRVCLECDDHDYHERTKEQAAHDRRRDRYFQAKGWRVMRFTGSEIVRDIDGCVEEIRELLIGVIDFEYIAAWEREQRVRKGLE